MNGAPTYLGTKASILYTFLPNFLTFLSHQTIQRLLPERITIPFTCPFSWDLCLRKPQFCRLLILSLQCCLHLIDSLPCNAIIFKSTPHPPTHTFAKKPSKALLPLRLGSVSLDEHTRPSMWPYLSLGSCPALNNLCSSKPMCNFMPWNLLACHFLFLQQPSTHPPLSDALLCSPTAPVFLSLKAPSVLLCWIKCLPPWTRLSFLWEKKWLLLFLALGPTKMGTR